MELRVESDAGQRLDAYLAARLEGVSRSRIQECIRDQWIRRNGQPAKPRDTVAIGDLLQVEIPEDLPAEAAPESLPLEILYEDEAMIVLNKAVGMVVHPAAGNATGTLVNALLHHTGGKLSTLGGTERPGIVHRLDKDTSGCLVAAKTDACHEALVAQFAGRTTAKRYLAVVQGRPREPRQTIFTHIGRHPVQRMKMAVVTPPTGKPSITDYEELLHDPQTHTTLLGCDLHTGRTHQIRVHLHHIGCPILGDPIYAKPARQTVQPGRLMLHARRLALDHPLHHTRLSFEAPVPREFTPWLQPLDTPP
jgi:23S rRNA pseudouridine1911/1915/1917 synthase